MINAEPGNTWADDRGAGELLAYDDLVVDLAAYKAVWRGRPFHLGPKEFRLLVLLLRRPEFVCSRSEISSVLWASGRKVDARTVDVHVTRLRSAMKRVGAGHLIRTVRSVGYAIDAGR